MDTTGISRRSLLLAAAGLPLAGCVDKDSKEPPVVGPDPSPGAVRGAVRLEDGTNSQDTPPPTQVWTRPEEVDQLTRMGRAGAPLPPAHILVRLSLASCGAREPRLVETDGVVRLHTERDPNGPACAAQMFDQVQFLVPRASLPHRFTVGDITVDDDRRLGPNLWSAQVDQKVRRPASDLVWIGDERTYERLWTEGRLTNVPAWDPEFVILLGSAPEPTSGSERGKEGLLRLDRDRISWDRLRGTGDITEYVWVIPRVVFDDQVHVQGMGAPVRVR